MISQKLLNPCNTCKVSMLGLGLGSGLGSGAVRTATSRGRGILHYHHQHHRRSLNLSRHYQSIPSCYSSTVSSTKQKRNFSFSSATTIRLNFDKDGTIPTTGTEVGSAASAASASDHHKLYLEQIQELESERIELFGSNDAITSADSNVDSSIDSSIDSSNDMQRTMDEINQEREDIYNFSKEEKIAWGSSSSDTNSSNISNDTSDTMNNNNNPINHKHSPELMNAIQKAREAKALYQMELEKETSNKVDDIIQEFSNTSTNTNTNTNTNENTSTSTTTNSTNHEDENNPIFTHLNKNGEEVSMVDVGDKTVSKRIAVARSSVLFPPEVMEAFGLVSTSSSTSSSTISGDDNDGDDGSSTSTSNEIIGPKGPIFATARLAGIMGAKRTSDLIPLCHPLPLSKVHVDIKLDGNRAIIECECRVTHKTGVEMEALAGASVAALTIYDMVKAVSHNVRIESTFLVKKSGGKRDVS